jgi:uncharacterized protein (DUF1501 family)
MTLPDDRRLTRRSVLRSTIHGSSLVALGTTVPGFLARTARAAIPERDRGILVVIQLDGGNDGINTVVPYTADGYARHRKALRLRPERLIKVADGIGLHPAMKDAAALIESGRLAIVQGVGYPNPSRSHFESMAIWHSGRTGERGRNGPGWLGQAFSSAGVAKRGVRSMLYVGAGAIPVALWGRASAAAALDRADDFDVTAEVRAGRGAIDMTPGDDLTAFVRRSMLDAYASADRITELTRQADRGERYPDTALAGRLRTIAGLLKAGFGARVYYTTQPGYDTHAVQEAPHAALLAELSSALRSFLDDLAAAGLAERVAVLAFSEFGRRVAENGSLGTDHGTAGPVLLAGPGVRPGLVGEMPSLTDLIDGDLQWTVDFRRIYASALEYWLGIRSEVALGGRFEPLELFRS